MTGLIVFMMLSAGPIPGIDSTSDYLVYYGSWNDELIFRAQDFDLVVLEPSNITAEQLQAIRKGHDGIEGTDDDVIVLAYVSIGEVSDGNISGNGLGPCYYDPDSDAIIYENQGYASFYLDDADHNGVPDRNGTWGSYYVYAGDTTWWDFVEAEADAALAKGADGLFLDTVDTASPWGNYGWTAQGMSALISHLRDRYPDIYLMPNRGLFYFDPHQTAYAWNIRPFINAVLFECYYTEWDWNNNRGVVSPYFDNNRDYWAYYVNNEAHQDDGFTVFALDYLNPDQSDYDSLLQNQIQFTISDQAWVDYVSTVMLDGIYYGVFHNHPDGDRNPPTWDNSIGVGTATAESTSVILRWGPVSDQTEPIHFNVYYSTSSFNDPSDATDSLLNVPAVSDTYGIYVWRYTVSNLQPNTTYYFMVRAEDSATPSHEDQNRVVVSVTTGSGGQSGGITIDGVFDDWLPGYQLDTNDHPEEAGDGLAADGDFVDLWSTYDTVNLYYSYLVAGSIDFNSYFYHIFLDTDRNVSTGYRGQGNDFSIGADYMVENGALWHYTGTGGSDWSWESAGNINYAIGDNNSRIELAIPFSSLNTTPGSVVWSIFNINQATSPYSQSDIAPNDYTNYHYPIGSAVVEENRTHILHGVKIMYSNGQLMVNLADRSELKLYDAAGRMLGKWQFAAGSHRLNIGLPSGVYIATVRSGNRTVSRKIAIFR